MAFSPLLINQLQYIYKTNSRITLTLATKILGNEIKKITTKNIHTEYIIPKYIIPTRYIIPTK